MKLSEIPRNIVYAIVFGFMGFIAGIWAADLLYTVILKNMERVTTTHISLIIIVLITASAFILGFSRGKELLE